MKDTQYIIHNGKRPLSYFFPNGNGKPKDIIGFSWKSYEIFDTEEQAQERINLLRVALNYMKIDHELRVKINRLINDLQISKQTITVN